ncbi:MAG: T9SS type A sorting domain-containing protein [bacterium]|nr:T9SS type A sorting domain-containing protein [bacterium]
MSAYGIRIKLALLLMLSCIPAIHCSSSADASSIHETELEYWRAREQAGWQPWRDPQDLPVAPLAHRSRALSHEVHGYYPYWQGSAYQDFDWSLLSTVAFFALELEPDGSIGGTHGWPWTGLVNAAHAGGCRVIVTATNFSTSELTTLLSTPAHRDSAVSKLVAAVQAGGADGVNVDFESLPYSQRWNFVTFIEELDAALLTALATPYLSVATPAVDWVGSYYYEALAARCDHLMIMGYNYHWSGSATTGPVAPLTGWGTYNVSWSVQDHITWGAPRGSLLLGVPYYGWDWPAEGPNPGDATTATASAITFAAAYAEGLSHGLLWDDEGQTTWYRYLTDSWHQVWFEDDVSLGLKYDYLKGEQLAGIGIWALGYDAPRTELWTALEQAFDSQTSLPGGEDAPLASTPFALEPIWPNPVMSGIDTHLRYTLLESTSLRISVHDVRGREIEVIASGFQRAGSREVVWRPGELPNGCYLVRFVSGNARAQRKVLLLR